MNQERTQYIGHFGVVFLLHRFTVAPSDRSSLQHLRLSERGLLDYEINNLVMNLYGRMQAGNLECEMLVGISKPLHRDQADMFNKQRITLASVAGGLVGFASKPFWLYGAPVAPLVSSLVYRSLEPRHAGDIIIIADARVKGGIGPQSSTLSLLIKADGAVDE